MAKFLSFRSFRIFCASLALSIITYLYFTVDLNQHQFQLQLQQSNKNKNNLSKSLAHSELKRLLADQKALHLLASKALKSEEKSIAESLANFNFTFDFKVKVPPIRNMILTTWRSGSTFLGEAVANHPAMFYHYEPLMHFNTVQARGELAEEGVRVIRKLLRCDYSQLDDYFAFGKEHSYVHSFNWRLFRHCQERRELCQSADFLASMCKLYPFQVMKTVRLRLAFVEPLLQDDNDELDLRILLLVRDPRGTMNSRRPHKWCEKSPDCSEPSRLCADLVDDYNAAINLMEKYPGKIMILRYEDFALNPFSEVEKVLEFFRLEFHPDVREFLETHTTTTGVGASGDRDRFSTFRDSKSTAFKWIEYYTDGNNTKELEEIQGEDVCIKAMDLWGYDALKIDTDIDKGYKSMEEFKPNLLLEPPWEKKKI